MGYVAIGALPPLPTWTNAGAGLYQARLKSRGVSVNLDSYKRLMKPASPFASVPYIEIAKNIVNASVESRKFFTGVIKDWIDQDRGVEFFPGYERGYKSKGWDGKYGNLGTTYQGRFWDFSGIYNKSTSSLDNMRAAAVVVCFLRDPVHFVKVWGGRVGKQLLGPLGLGEVSLPSPETVPAADVLDDPAEASQGEAVDFLKFFKDILGAIQEMWGTFGPWVETMFDKNEPLIEEPQSQTPEDSPPPLAQTAPGFPKLPLLVAGGIAAYLLLKK